MSDRFLLVRVYTDQGIVGNGEAGLWAHHGMVKRAILDLSQYYRRQRSRPASSITSKRSAAIRISWAPRSVRRSARSTLPFGTLPVKRSASPFSRLLGGRVRDKVKVFQNIGGATAAACAPKAPGSRRPAGYLSLRMSPFLPGFEQKTASQVIGDAVAMVAAVRDAVGFEIDLGLEIHRNLRPEEAITLAHELLPFRILYYEDPLAPESLEAMEYIAKSVPLPMATGERFYNIFQFKDLIDRKIVSLIRPDLSLAGGFTQLKKIAAIAESAFVGVFPHLMGSPVNIAAYCQFAASIPNYFLMESHTGADAYNEIVDRPVTREGGYLLVSDRPGIGLEIDESCLQRYPHTPKRIFGNFHADGSVAH